MNVTIGDASTVADEVEQRPYQSGWSSNVKTLRSPVVGSKQIVQEIRPDCRLCCKAAIAELLKQHLKETSAKIVI
jgi:hypothetical protein